MPRRDRSPDSKDSRGPRAPEPAPFLSPSLIGMLTLGGVAVLIFMNVKLWGETGKLETSLGMMDARIGQLGTKVDAAARTAAQPPRPAGPDPNKVYQVKMEGSPTEGPATAPVTIAEFSDFQ